MQLLQNKHWQQILNEQRNQKAKELRTHIIAVNPPDNLYSHFDFITIKGQNRFWMNFKLEIFEDTFLGDLCIWWVDYRDPQQFLTSIMNFFSDKFNESIYLLAFDSQPQNLEIFEACSKIIQHLPATQINKNIPFKKIPYIIFTQDLNLLLRKAVCNDCATILTNLKHPTQLKIFTNYFKPTDIGVNPKGDFVLAGTDTLEVLNVVIKEVDLQLLEPQEKVDTPAKEQTAESDVFLEYIGKQQSIMLSKPVLDQIKEATTEAKIGSRYKAKLEKK